MITAVPPRVLFMGWLAQVAIRFFLARDQSGPVANPDEAGYLVAARLLAGGPGTDYSGHTFYQAGYPLLLVPINWLTDDPQTVYHLTMLVNALIGALIFPLAYSLLRRLGQPKNQALLVAWPAALLPAVVIFGRFALADAVLPVIVLAWLLALDRTLQTSSQAMSAAASALAAYATSVHSRGTIVLAVHVLVLVVSAVIGRRQKLQDVVDVQVKRKEEPGRGGTGLLTRREQRLRVAQSPHNRRPFLVGLGVVVIAFLAVKVLHGWLMAGLYPGGARDLGGILGERVTSVGGQAWAWSGAAGQIWYLVVSTWGLGGVGLLAVIAAAVKKNEHRAMALVLLAVTFGIAYGSMAALPDENRVGNFAYGRYLTCVALVYTLVGLTVLAKKTQIAAVAGILLLTGGWVSLYAGERLETAGWIPFDFPEVIFLTQNDGGLNLRPASLVALGLLALLWATRGKALIVVNLAALVMIVQPFTDVAETPGLAFPRDGVVIEETVPWYVKPRLITRVHWTEIRTWNRGQPVPEDVCTVITSQNTPGPDGWHNVPFNDEASAWVCR